MAESWKIYIENGNSSSTTVITILNELWRKNRDASTRLRKLEERALDGNHIIAVAFGPGMHLDLMLIEMKSN